MALDALQRALLLPLLQRLDRRGFRSGYRIVPERLRRERALARRRLGKAEGSDA